MRIDLNAFRVDTFAKPKQVNGIKNFKGKQVCAIFLGMRRAERSFISTYTSHASFYLEKKLVAFINAYALFKPLERFSL